MAFMQKDIHALVKSWPTIWAYRTGDTSVQVSKRGYFENFRESLAVGDWIMATTSTGGVILHVDEIDPLELGTPR
jgi:exosome complex RNA-binding protein Csl4